LAVRSISRAVVKGRVAFMGGIWEETGGIEELGILALPGSAAKT
jgi:hypothetical protein